VTISSFCPSRKHRDCVQISVFRHPCVGPDRRAHVQHSCKRVQTSAIGIELHVLGLSWSLLQSTRCCEDKDAHMETSWHYASCALYVELGRLLGRRDPFGSLYT
jgi:hypothetical protein